MIRKWGLGIMEGREWVCLYEAKLLNFRARKFNCEQPLCGRAPYLSPLLADMLRGKCKGLGIMQK
jgi:hypothetical protein